MLLPSKIFSYNESVLSKLATVLTNLDIAKTPNELMISLRGSINNAIEFIDVLDCLYALGKIDIDNEGRIYKC